MLATLRNPPYFDFTMKSEPGKYHGFFWFYFFNETSFPVPEHALSEGLHTVPRVWFWLFHLLWLFPWSAFLPAALRFKLGPPTIEPCKRGCWRSAGRFPAGFFSFSTTQEYYSMPCYPALALLLGAAMAESNPWLRYGQRAIAVVAGLAVCNDQLYPVTGS